MRGKGETHAVAPVRADLVGGTLDLWPLGLLHPGSVTAAVSVSMTVSARVVAASTTSIHSMDLARRITFDPSGTSLRRGRLELLERIVRELFADRHVALTTQSSVPAGSGLGGSSALGVAAAAALTAHGGRPVRRAHLVALVRDIEAQVIGIPTGTQDHVAAVRGGLTITSHRPGMPRVERRTGPLLRALRDTLILVDSGTVRSSAPSNWDMFRRRIDGDPAARRALDRVVRAGIDGVAALDEAPASLRSWTRLGRAMQRDLDARREWSPLVLTPELERVFAIAAEAGALGWRVCGAGGGGFAVVLTRPGRRRDVVEALSAAGFQVSGARPTARGLTVHRAQRPSSARATER